MKIQFVRSKEIILTTHARLATVGSLLAHTKQKKRLNRTVFRSRSAFEPYTAPAFGAAAASEKSDWNRILPEESADLWLIAK